jgi:hypothetical protein
MAIPPVRVRVQALTLIGLYRLAELVYLQTGCEAPDCHMVKNSDLMKGKRGVTAEVYHVDSGYHVVGMKPPGAPHISLSKD